MEVEQQRFAPHAHVWVSSEDDVWVEAKVVQQEGDSVVVRVGADKKAETRTVKATVCFAKEDGGKGVDDMTKLAYLHEPGVLHNLYLRYQLNQIYTYTGSILIAVNPFARIPGLYEGAMKSLYQGARLGELAPHVFAIADTAYRAMRENNLSQSILISGESGAGKTETTKLVMEYLAGVGGRTSADKRSVETQVLESNPILEAFGNAKTVRNNNSSRFGKFIEIQFDPKGRVSGAAIKSYLLERSRVVKIKDPERNYHCFYQLCFGASPEEIEKYKLPGTSKRAQLFRYLNQSRCYELGGKETNAMEYANTRRAMGVLGFTAAEQSSVFAVVAAILHLGNVDFLESGGIGDPLLIQPGTPTTHLNCVADLLGVDREALKESLCTITRKVAGETLKSPLDAKAAEAKRDSLAKNLYSTLFDWIVAKANASIGEDESAEVSIGVLDIYGFEHFEYNSFEQFCINLANEKLQQHFNQHVLKMEQEEYEREEIDWSRIPFNDNQDVLDLIEKDRGILSLLDSACKLTSTTAESFTRSLYNECGRHSRFSRSNFSKTDFTLEHYAGKVKYSTNEFLAKNVDAVVPEHHVLLSNSTDAFVAGLFPREKLSGKQNKFVSLGSSFKLQLGELMMRLNETEPHYIRCVKPNSKLKPHLFEKPLVMSQLRSGGVLEAVRMCSAGYPTRRSFDDFLERFTMLAPLEVDYSRDERENIVRLMAKTGIQNYQIGLTKVFLRAGQMVLLETMRLEMMNRAARRIQRSMRRYFFSLHRKRAALVLETVWRGYITQRLYVNLRMMQAAAICQKHVRRFLQHRAYERLRKAAVLCQSLVRAKQAKKRYTAMVEDMAATKVQKVWRGYQSRKPLEQLRRFVRGRVARKKLAKLKKEAAVRNDLVHQANEAMKRATAATSQALAGSLRFMVVQRMREKADRERKSALEQLASAQREIEELKGVVGRKEEEVARLQGALRDARQQATKAAQAVEKATGEPLLNSTPRGTPRASPRASPELVPSTPPAAPPILTIPEEGAEPAPSPLQTPTKASTPKAAPVPSQPEGPAPVSTRPSSTAHALSFSPPQTQMPLPPPASRRTLGRSMSMQPAAYPRVEIPSSTSPGPTPASTPTVAKAGPKTGSVDSQVFDKLLTGMQKEVEASQKLKQENQVLRGMKKEAETRAEAAAKEAEEMRKLKGVVEEQLSAKDMEIRDLEGRIMAMQEKLAGRERLEQEVKILSNRILAITAVNRPQLPPDKQQEVLLQEVGGDNNLGFSPNGHPVVATVVYKALVHWKTFEAERTNTFDRVVETFQQAARDGNTNVLSYWMTNTVWLYFLVQEEYKPASPKPVQGFLFFGKSEPAKREEHVDTMLFKLQLGTSVERLYVTIRDNVKSEMHALLNGSNPAANKSMSEGGAVKGGLSRSGSNVRRQVASYWTGLLVVLRQTVDTMQFNRVPPFLLHALLRQLLMFMDVKIFNSLMVRSQWCPCTYSNGEVMESGLHKLLSWLDEVQYWLEDALGPAAASPLSHELCHIQQAVAFLLCDRKPQRSIDEIRQLCPQLSMNQLVHICIWYEDDKYNTKGVEPGIIERMWALMVEDSPMLLRDDESIPFTIDEAVSSMEHFDLDEVEPPSELLQDGSFVFLLPQEEELHHPGRTPSVRSPLWGDAHLLFSQPPTPQISRRFEHADHALAPSRRSYESPPTPHSLSRR